MPFYIPILIHPKQVKQACLPVKKSNLLFLQMCLFNGHYTILAFSTVNPV